MQPPLDPRARDAPRLGLYGGSFDPVHRGHLHCASVARAAGALDHVVLVPARQSPHKLDQRPAAGAERLQMCRLAFAELPWASVWGVELEREGPSYTVDTLRELARLRGGSQGLHLILGDDNLPGLPSWRGVEELLRLGAPLVVHRERAGEDALGALEGALSPAALERLRAGLAPCQAVEISSSELRERLRAGGDGRPELPDSVWEYARQNGIYGAR